jgi:acyl-CoA thioester hydrolase
MAPPSREQFRHFVEIPVRWGDMDAFGHVNNAVFVQYIESGRVDYFTTVLDSFGHTDEGPILGEVTCRFLTQVEYPADLHIGTRVVGLSNRTLRLQTGIFVADNRDPAAVGLATVVWFDYRAQQSATLPARLLDAVVNFEPEPPERG